jgi:hypothetical protein
MEVDGPEDFDYGKREGPRTDPDGNKFRFDSPLPNAAKFKLRTVIRVAAREKKQPRPASRPYWRLSLTP